jgi:hypothetical protein
MASRKAPPPGPAPFNLEALRAVREQLGAAYRDDGEPFTFAPDVETVASWLQGGVAFGIPLGSPRAILDDLGDLGAPVDERCDIFGSDTLPSDPLRVEEPEKVDVNEYLGHCLSVGIRDDVIIYVNYDMHGWSYSDDAINLHMGKRGGFVGDDGAPLPRHDNARFRAVLTKVLQAAGFLLKAPPARAGKKERDLNGGGVRVSWRRGRAESLFDTVGFTVYAWSG